MQAAEEHPGGDQRDVQTEGALILVGQAGMGSFRVEHLHKTFEEILTVGRPFIPLDGKKTNLVAGEECTTVLGGLRARRAGRIDLTRDIIEQALHEGPELGVGGRPLAARMRLDGVIEMASCGGESKCFRSNRTSSSVAGRSISLGSAARMVGGTPHSPQTIT
ncbi:hypothetical protein EOA60_06940 [Mesorhizobium sp. M1A.F.Ca.IN.020.06.1.1]|uniref:hypothetical protein n=1 Tax=Mesorhizobium sp. M1A.F.Ca.IN.020.06.1.1 TaxID=2496765 RepID=UPI000FD50C30|nr:hypothetical protein [Mesorhizobium sp. M1A.F.Ca.IN.020.06.1.1]RUW33911.1 hypothetical protein EOA60_06940 [Mesorhizobium sp. M1A.F.Ca.IN.020.06.1.1]